MDFSGQEYLNWLPCPPPEDLPNPVIQPEFLVSPALAGGFFIRQMSGQVSRGSAGEYQADDQAGVAWLSWRV